MSSRDLVALAMEHALTITGETIGLAEDAARKLRGRLRSRARELPSLVMDVGLVPALLFFLSKTDENAYGEAVKVLPCGGEEAGGSPELEAGNKYAYALVARAVLCALTDVGVGRIKNPNNINTIKGAIYELLELRRSGELEATLELVEYLVSLKRAGEALWEKEE